MKKDQEEKRIFYVEYRDGGDYGCAEEVEVYESELFIETGLKHSGEKIAVMKVTQTLLDEHDYMSELVNVYEVTPKVAIHDDEPGDWKLKDGTVLDQEDQDTLNDAMFNMVNEDGMTLTQVWDKEIEEEEEKEKNK